MNSQQSTPMGHSKGSPEREVYSDTGLPKKNRNISNKQPNHTPTRTRGTTTKTAESKYKEGNNQDQSRIKQILKAQFKGSVIPGAGCLKT